MNENRLEEVRRQLDEELRHAEAESQRLKAELEGVEADRKAIGSAVAALGRKRGAPAKPAARKAQVIGIVEELLRVNGPIDEADLKALVEERLASLGKSLSGFGLRFGEAMNDPRFDRNAAGVVDFTHREYVLGDAVSKAGAETRRPASTAAPAANSDDAAGHEEPLA